MHECSGCSGILYIYKRLSNINKIIKKSKFQSSSKFNGQFAEPGSRFGVRTAKSSEAPGRLEQSTVSHYVLHGLGRVATWTWCCFLHAPKLEGLTDTSGAGAKTVESHPLLTSVGQHPGGSDRLSGGQADRMKGGLILNTVVPRFGWIKIVCDKMGSVSGERSTWLETLFMTSLALVTATETRSWRRWIGLSIAI